MQIGGTYFNYLMVCHRKLWLFANGIGMEHTSEAVAEGKLLHETVYPSRAAKYEELEIGNIKIDFYDPRNRVIHEIKRSDRMEEAHLWQVKYYMYILEQCGIEGVTALLEYPSMRQTEPVAALAPEDRAFLDKMTADIDWIVHDPSCPPIPSGRKGVCRKCSYYDFCYAGEAVPEMAESEP